MDIKPSEYEKIGRDQIIGLETVLEEVDNYINFLRNFDEYSKYNANIPVGVIFYGPRGTGKTKTAKYLATESKAFFINLDDHRDKSIEEVFEIARKIKEKEGRPVIIFQDEFDKRFFESTYSGLRITEEGNKLLKILDGIRGKKINYGIFFVGTANNVGEKGIDNPLFRPGRLEKLYFYPPTRENKEKLIDFFLSEFISECKDEIEVDVDSRSLSYLFNEDDTPAFIEAVVRDSYFNAVDRYLKNNKKGKLTLSTEDIYKTIVKRKIEDPIILDMTDGEKKVVATHELGHYLVGDELGIEIPFVSIIPTIQSLGQTFLNDKRKNANETYIKNLISTAQGGYLAEEIFLNQELSLNAESDIQFAEELAKKLDKLYRYRDKCRKGNQKDDQNRNKEKILSNNEYSEPEKALCILVDAMTNDEYTEIYTPKILQECEERARGILTNYDKSTIEELSSKLIEQKTLFSKDIENYLGNLKRN